jgi:glycosyltransferase involved in cell wall biosynthesis
MTYTGGGKDYLVRQGRMSGHRVTAIGNATDTGPIRAGFVAGLYDGYQIDAKVPRPRKALYVGGLDPSKRIDFLIAAARHAHFLDPNFELIVVGMGELSADVRSAQRDGVPISLIGEARGSELGKLGILADALWMPGRVGLAAIDAVAMGLIVHTTNYGFHAPEIELLNSDEVTFLPDDPRLFAEKSLSQMALRPAPHLRNLRKDAPTIESVSLAFTKVVLNVLRSRA